jgi:hypothetical protein
MGNYTNVYKSVNIYSSVNKSVNGDSRSNPEWLPTAIVLVAKTRGFQSY